MKITDQELDSLSLDELQTMMDMLQGAIGRKKEDEYATAREKVDKIASSLGLSASELLDKTEKPVKSVLDDNYHP